MEREILLNNLQTLGREQSAKAVMLHQRIGDKLGLSASEIKCLDYILREPQMTASRLAKLSGLTVGTIAVLLDRLEQKRYIARQPHPSDKRKTIIQPHLDEIMPKVGHIYQSLGEAWMALCDEYTSKELTFIVAFIQKSNQMVQQELDRM
jgi:hypothetical protein